MEEKSYSATPLALNSKYIEQKVMTPGTRESQIPSHVQDDRQGRASQPASRHDNVEVHQAEDSCSRPRWESVHE